MKNNGVFDEGLVAAAIGLFADQNPYPEGSAACAHWREGFLSYGVNPLCVPTHVGRGPESSETEELQANRWNES